MLLCSIFFYYSLLYHALIHKKSIANDYKELLAIKDNNDIDTKFIELKTYLDSKEYHFVYPKDYSVYFNDKFFPFKMELSRFLYFKFYLLFN